VGALLKTLQPVICEIIRRRKYARGDVHEESSRVPVFVASSPTYECFGVSVNATCQGMSGSFSSYGTFVNTMRLKQAELI